MMLLHFFGSSTAAMKFDNSSLIPLWAILTPCVLLASTRRSRTLPPTQRTFRMYLIVNLIWALFALLSYGGIGDNQIWKRVLLAAEVVSLLAIAHFIMVFLEKKLSRITWIILPVLGITFASLCLNFIAQHSLPDKRLLQSVDLTCLLLGISTGIGFCLFSLASILHARRLTKDNHKRSRMRYLTAGLTVILLTTMLHWYFGGKYAIDIAGNCLAALLVTWSVFQPRSLDLGSVFRKSVLYIVPTVIIAALYFLVLTISQQLLKSLSGQDIVLISMLVAVLSALAAQSFRTSVQQWIDRLFFRAKYDTSLMLQRISRTSVTYLEVDMLANMIIDEVVSTLNIEKAAFFLKDNPAKEFHLIAHHNLGANVNFRLSADHPVAVQLQEIEQPLGMQEIELLPQFRSLWGEERQVLEWLEAELFIPLINQGNLVGILSVGAKTAEKPYSPADKATFITLSNQIAVAIENARLFAMELKSRKELDSLYRLSRELIATDTIDTVMEKVVNHALESIHVTFTRILIRNDEGNFYCGAALPVNCLTYELRAGQYDPKEIYRFYETALENNEPLVLDDKKFLLTEDERRFLFLEQVHSLCICPLKIGSEPLGILFLGERRHANRESFDSDKLRLATAIADQASSAIQRASLYEQLEESFVQTVVALANAIDARDSYTSDHSERLSRLARATAGRLNCSSAEIQAIDLAMHLHDIGKIGVPDEVLQKPGALSPEEWEQMKRHPAIGAQIIAPVKRLHDVVPLVRAHHEKFDGSGYPDQLKGEKIPLGARILSVVDAYGAITDNRVYRKARTHAEAILEIRRCAGTQFDPAVVDAFVAVVDEFYNSGIPIKQETLYAAEASLACVKID